MKCSCYRSRDATRTILRHPMTSGASMLRLSAVSMPKTACTLPTRCMLPKASTLSTPKTSCTLPRVSVASTPRRTHPSRRATTSLLPKKATTNPWPRMVTGLGTTMSPLPQGQLAVYIVQCDNEPLTANGNRVAYAVQGNDKPFATMDDWAMTFDDREGAKAPTVRLIATITILHHRKSAIVPAMKLVCLRPPLQHMHWSKTLMSSSRQATPTRLHRATNNIVHCRSNNNNYCVRTSGTCRSRQQSLPLLASAQAPQDKRLVSEGAELLTTINLIGDWPMGNSDQCTLKVSDAQILRRLSGARFAPLHILHKLQHNNS
jgi:hypothetical protein